MHTLTLVTLRIFVVLCCLVMINIALIAYIKLYENNMIHRYGDHYSEDHFREASQNENSLITTEDLERYHLHPEFRYKGRELESGEDIFFEGNREGDKAVTIDNDEKENWRIFTRRLFQNVPTKEQLKDYFLHLKNIDKIGVLTLQEGYYILFLVKDKK